MEAVTECGFYAYLALSKDTALGQALMERSAGDCSLASALPEALCGAASVFDGILTVGLLANGGLDCKI